MAARLLFLFGDQGGGHRAAATAVAKACDERYPGRFEIELLDPFAEGSRPFLRWFVSRYNWMLTRLPALYGMAFWVTDKPTIARTALRLFSGQYRSGIRRNLSRLQPHGVVAFHPLTIDQTAEAIRALGLDVRLITVTTEITYFHTFWLSNKADIVVLPSAQAQALCLSRGLDERRARVGGVAVDPRFAGPPDADAKRAIRKRLGLEDRPTLLLLAGGEGVGRLAAQANALDQADLGLQLLVVCGRNQRVRRLLEQRTFRSVVRILGYIDNMPELMRASDAVVTKAGPGTIAEALISGLPIFLTDYVPAQERRNVGFVVDQGAGCYTTSLTVLVDLVRKSFVDSPEDLAEMRARAGKVFDPGGAERIAELIAEAVDPSQVTAVQRKA